MSPRRYIGLLLILALACTSRLLAQERGPQPDRWVVPETLVLLDSVERELTGVDHELAAFRIPEYVDGFLGPGLLQGNPESWRPSSSVSAKSRTGPPATLAPEVVLGAVVLLPHSP